MCLLYFSSQPVNMLLAVAAAAAEEEKEEIKESRVVLYRNHTVLVSQSSWVVFIPPHTHIRGQSNRDFYSRDRFYVAKRTEMISPTRTAEYFLEAFYSTKRIRASRVYEIVFCNYGLLSVTQPNQLFPLDPHRLLQP